METCNVIIGRQQPETAAQRQAVAELQEQFTYHAPTADQLPRYLAIRKAGFDLAKTILLNAPQGADSSAAIRKVREAVMTANAAIALENS